MKGTLYIVIPAYNEEENILNVINQWYPVIKAHSAHGTSRLVIIDDGSKDSTYHIMLEASKTRPLLLPITKENSGHGGTVLYGYKYALDNGADYVFQTDSDGQTLPSDFEKFWWQRDNYDMVIGWRKGRQDGISRMDLIYLTFCYLSFMPKKDAAFIIFQLHSDRGRAALTQSIFQRYVRLEGRQSKILND